MSSSLINSGASSAPVSNRPPTELQEDRLIRKWVVLPFVLFFSLIGGPLWFLTTSIYRAPLDYDQMMLYDNSISSLVDIQIPLYIHSSGVRLPDIVPATQLVIDHKLAEYGVPKGWRLKLHDLDAKDTPFHSIESVLNSTDDSIGNGAYLVQLVLDDEREHTRISPYSREIVISYSQQAIAAGDLPEFVAVELINTFGDEIDQFLDLIDSKSSTNGHNHNNPDSIHRKNSKVVAAAHSPQYHITFSLFVQGGEPVSWDIAKALKDHFTPLKTELSARVSNFTIDTQVQFYSTLTQLPKKVTIPAKVRHVTKQPPPQPVSTGADGEEIVSPQEPIIETIIDEPEKNQFIYTQDDLSTFVNFAEWSLSSIHSYPSLNFILFVPSPEYTPLLVEGSSTNSFIIPQWGGVIIHNDPALISGSRNASESPLKLTSENLDSILETFTSQLFSLLGAPSSPSSPLFRIDILSRNFALRSLFNAASSLGSLNRLSISLPTIAIPKSVQSNVEASLESIKQTLSAFKSERWTLAAHFSAEAMNTAHDAFFEKMMVQQMYFPDEHKIAVYLPLLGPIIAITFVGFSRILKEASTKKKNA